MKTRASKRLALGAALLMATLAMNPAFADGKQKFKIRIAGGFVQNIQQMQVYPDGTPTLMEESRSIALVKGRGTFGRVDIMAVTVSSGPSTSGKSCSRRGFVPVADILENNLVLTFGDLSLLYGNGTGVVCLNLADTNAFPLAEIDGTWDGGTGRFRRAGGKWSIRFDFAERVSPDGSPDTQFVAETGVIKGHVTRRRDND